jgi:hypothetical protein
LGLFHCANKFFLAGQISGVTYVPFVHGASGGIGVPITTGVGRFVTSTLVRWTRLNPSGRNSRVVSAKSIWNN